MDEVIGMSIGSKLAQARRAANLTQEQLAERLGVTRQAVSRWESDAAYPETDKIIRMAQLLNVSCDYLLRDDIELGDRSAPPPDPVTRLLKQAVGRRVRLAFYEEAGGIFSADGLPSGSDCCTILGFDGAWANVEYMTVRKGAPLTREYLVPLSSIRSITFLKEGQ